MKEHTPSLYSYLSSWTDELITRLIFMLDKWGIVRKGTKHATHSVTLTCIFLSEYLASSCLIPFTNDVIENLHFFKFGAGQWGSESWRRTPRLPYKGHRDFSVNLGALFTKSDETVFVDHVVLLVLQPERSWCWYTDFFLG